MLNLQGKVAFIAGAGSVGEGWGNGKATAVLMARQGAQVFGLDMSADALASTTEILKSEGLAGHWHAVTCNMTNSQDVEAAVSSCVERFGRIDILVNNVGGSAQGDPVSMSEEIWYQQL